MKKLWNSIKMILYIYVVQYVMIVVGVSLFAIIISNNNLLSNANNMYEISIIGVIITSIMISVYLYRNYKKKENKVSVNNVLLMILLGVCISSFCNMITINFMEEEIIDINKILLYSYMVIIGPIFEEMVFRYVGLRFAKEEYSLKKAIVITSIVFALLHSGLFNMIYAFLIGIVLSYIYVRYRNILYPIILHISANLMSVCITDFNLITLIISALGLAIICIFLIKENHV